MLYLKSKPMKRMQLPWVGDLAGILIIKISA